jgi:SH3-like domain-containing protein
MFFSQMQTFSKRRESTLSTLCCLVIAAVSSSEADTATFASLKSSEINLRVGPGKEYPIAWVILKQKLPVILVAEFDQWRKIKLLDNSEGWVHKNMISGKNTVITVADNVIMYKHSSRSYPIAKIEKNVVMSVLKKESGWLKVEINAWKGWIERKNVWGIDDAE